MEKQIVNCQRSRAKVEIHTHGGRVFGQHKVLPIVYAHPPLSEPLWPVIEVVEVVRGVRKVTRTSNIDGCTVIWG